MWGKEHRDGRQELVESRIDRNAVPDAIGYYPTIFIMQVAVVLLLLIGSLLALLNNPSPHAFILFALTFLTVIWFSLSALKWRPNRCKNLIEEDRIRWELVFNNLALKGIKKYKKIEQGAPLHGDNASFHPRQ